MTGSTSIIVLDSAQPAVAAIPAQSILAEGGSRFRPKRSVVLIGRSPFLGVLRGALEESGYDVQWQATPAIDEQRVPATIVIDVPGDCTRAGQLLAHAEHLEEVGLLTTDPTEPLDGAIERIKFALRRRPLEVDGATSTLLHVDEVRQQAFLHGQLLQLAKKEFDLLRYFVANRGAALSRESLLRHVWGYEFFGGERTVDVHVKRLREKLRNNELRFIETVRSVGYRWEPAPIV